MEFEKFLKQCDVTFNVRFYLRAALTNICLLLCRKEYIQD